MIGTWDRFPNLSLTAPPTAGRGRRLARQVGKPDPRKASALSPVRHPTENRLKSISRRSGSLPSGSGFRRARGSGDRRRVSEGDLGTVLAEQHRDLVLVKDSPLGGLVQPLRQPPIRLDPDQINPVAVANGVPGRSAGEDVDVFEDRLPA